MIQWVKDLLELQDVDMRIRRMDQRLSMIPQEIENLRAAIRESDNAVKTERESMNKTALEIKQLESRIKQKNDQIAKLQCQSSMVKKNTEYQAMMKEIDELRNGISDLETEEIELLDKVEADKAAFRNAEKQLRAGQQNNEDEIRELEQLTGELGTETERLKLLRAPMIAKLDTALISRYQRLLESGGMPLVKVESGICGHCHLRLIPQTLHEINKGAVTVCENCAHLLYL